MLNEVKPKHIISDTKKFRDDRDKLGYLINQEMNTTGGTDVDWLIEHRGGFIVMENKTFWQNKIGIPLGQMIAFERLHARLNNNGKCYFLFFGFDNNTDFQNPESRIWYFCMDDWKAKKITNEYDSKHKRYIVLKENMAPTTIKGFQVMMEKYWKEFENH